MGSIREMQVNNEQLDMLAKMLDLPVEYLGGFLLIGVESNEDRTAYRFVYLSPYKTDTIKELLKEVTEEFNAGSILFKPGPES